MNSSRGMTTVALVGLLAGCAATVDGAMGVPSDGGASRDAVAADAPLDASVGCEGVIDVERAGVAVPGGRRVMLDLSRTPPLPGVDPTRERVRHRALVSVVAPDEGVLAVAAQNLGWTAGGLQDANVLVSRVASCSPFALVIDEPGVMPRERLFDGQGRRFRVRRGESIVFALDISPAFQSLSVELRMMTPRPLGATCWAPGEACPEGSVCALDGTLGQNRCGSGGAEGSACLGADPSCGAGLRCVVRGNNPGPVAPGEGAAVCRRVRAVGEACTPLDVCPEGTACGGSGPARCHPLGAAGAPCGEQAPCGAGLFCRGTLCASPVPAGSACESDCDTDTPCERDLAGQARCRRRGDLGGWCSTESPRCAPDLRCDARRSRCLLPLPLGAPCGEHLMGTCDGGRCDAGRCVRTGRLGEACRDDRADRCDVGLACDGQNLCSPTLAAESPCDSFGRDGVCANGDCIEGRCVANSGRAGEGCREGRCDDGLVCVERRCVPEAMVNGPCTSSPMTCGIGLRCWTPEGENGRCIFRDRDARACGPGGACASGRICVEGECVAPGICDRLPMNAAPRAPCDRDRFCALDPETRRLTCVSLGSVNTPCREGSSPCDQGTSCTPAGWCRRVPGIGEACLPGVENLCTRGSDCVYGRCVADGSAVGAACRALQTRADACDPGLRCAEELGRCMNVNTSCRAFTGREDVCPADHDCDTRTRTVCLRRGALNGRCRELAPRCDEGLGCIPGGDTCVRLAGESEACDPGAEIHCAEDLRCVNGRCAREGVLNAPCLTPAINGRGCVSGLACVRGRCVTAVLEGGNCDDADDAKRCAEGMACVAEANGSRCRALGSVGAPCVNSLCDLGLACIRRVCMRTADVGGLCRPWSEGGPGCAWGPCVDGRCAANGTRGGRCGGTNGLCDAGLVCTRVAAPDYPDICLPPATSEALCASGALRCPGAASCVDERCVPDGAPGGACRVAATPRCDAPARCDPATARCAL
jgi:hypothetical protein